jgi:hypothetical protein
VTAIAVPKLPPPNTTTFSNLSSASFVSRDLQARHATLVANPGQVQLQAFVALAMQSALHRTTHASCAHKLLPSSSSSDRAVPIGASVCSRHLK